MTCEFSRVTAHIFMLCIMQNFRCIILSAIASATADTAQYISRNDSNSFIKLINKLCAVINIGKMDNDVRLPDFEIICNQ